MMFNCELLKLSTMCYILSLAFQVAGAVLLIIKYFGRTKERIMDGYFPSSSYVKMDRENSNNILLEKDKVQKCAREVYDNRMAFIFIAFGYILSIFGELQGESKICILAFMFVSTSVIILIEKLLSILISKILYKEGIKTSLNEIANSNSRPQELLVEYGEKD